jgi:hypothetical protein
MKHIDMRRLTPAAQEERRRQVVGLRESGLTYAAIGRQVGRNAMVHILSCLVAYAFKPGKPSISLTSQQIEA